MFGSKKKKKTKLKLSDLMAQLRPDLSPESLGVGPGFPGVAPNPFMSGAAMKRMGGDPTKIPQPQSSGGGHEPGKN